MQARNVTSRRTPVHSELIHTAERFAAKVEYLAEEIITTDFPSGIGLQNKHCKAHTYRALARCS